MKTIRLSKETFARQRRIKNKAMQLYLGRLLVSAYGQGKLEAFLKDHRAEDFLSK